MSVSLNWLFDGIATLPVNDARIDELTLDSREACPGSLFFALSGRRSHGLSFAAAAVSRGASVVLWESDAGFDQDPPAAPPVFHAGVFVAAVPGLHRLLGRLSDRFFGAPSSHLRIVGITGTNGKTTCAYLIAQCLARLNTDAAYIGTLGWGRLGTLQPLTHTTPDVISVHRMLAALRDCGVRDVAMEVSSHALDQGRLDGVRLHCAAFTNLSRDHLDYHHSMREYGAAKARLFAFSGLQHIVINIGDAFGRELATRHGGGAAMTVVWVSDGEGDGNGGAGWPGERCLYVSRVLLDLQGMAMTLDGSFGSRAAHAGLLGRFNVENCIVVLACLLALDVSLDDAVDALAHCTAPPGRMEVVAAPDGGRPLAVIDYAHTPDALAKALNGLREHCRGALWCVFGCGGDRDPGKRSMMGAVADECADCIIVTDDNPRSEDPQAITQSISLGMKVHVPRVIHDRGAAIAAALREAKLDDMVLIAGKGHEDYQIYGNERRNFSDRSEAARHLGAAA